MNSHESSTDESSESPSNIDTNIKGKEYTFKWATLYIQMNLCHSTLKEWLEHRNAATDPNRAVVPINNISLRSNTIRHIVTEITEALRYIHLKGIVHHDVKPGNILIQLQNNEIVAQLSDFGLACPQQSDGHSEGFGTTPYAAPEQLSGKCNPKSDMYSLGVVLFELVGNFHTRTETSQHITGLKKGTIPSDIEKYYPEFANIIFSLVKKNVDQRPDATQLLKELKSNQMNKLIDQLKVELSERDAEILRLREQHKTELAHRDAEILHLREMLKSYGTVAENPRLNAASCSIIDHMVLPEQNLA